MGAFILGCCYIDALARFHAGNIPKGKKLGDVFKDFVKKVMREYGPDADKLWDVRNGLIHAYATRDFAFTDAEKAGKHGDADPPAMTRVTSVKEAILLATRGIVAGFCHDRTAVGVPTAVRRLVVLTWNSTVSLTSETTLRTPYFYSAPDSPITEFDWNADLSASAPGVRQPYHLVLFGEKTSLRPVLEPLARRYHADLYLPTGEATDTMVYQLARTIANDPRPTIIFYLADCDPSGWQMSVSVARKLQALRDLKSELHDMEFKLYRVALTPDQVREYDLPVSPLQPTRSKAEIARRAQWVKLMHTEQTELDALAALNPDLLTKLVKHAMEPFFDHEFVEAMREWQEEADGLLAEAYENALGEIERIADEIEASIRCSLFRTFRMTRRLTARSTWTRSSTLIGRSLKQRKP